MPAVIMIAAALGTTSCVGSAEVNTSASMSTPAVVELVSSTASELSTSTAPTTAPATTSLATTTLLSTTVPTTAPSTTEPRPRSDELILEEIDRLTGDLASKSVVASGSGLFFAQNMMYRHTISVFDSDEQLVATIPDEVDLESFGFDVEPGLYRGAPVEAAFSSDGRFGYVSNYRMYGPGFSSSASDGCNKGAGQNSFVYRVDTAAIGTGAPVIDEIYEVGSVPKFVAVTPDDRLLLVSNWCTFDLSIIDLETGVTIDAIELGRHPRGIAVTSDSAIAYVTIMGGSSIAAVDLSTLEISWIENVGPSPRHLVLSPDDMTLYATLNGAGTVVKIDVGTGEVIDSVRTGQAPRSMAISSDGYSLYVVNYESDSMSKVRTADFEILQELRTAHHPIGITYDPLTDEVWVAAYSGVIHVYSQTEAPS